MRKFFILIVAMTTCFAANAQYRTAAQQQILTNEDSLSTGGISFKKTVISGYGSASYQHDFNAQHSVATLDRAVLFVGHKFTDKIAFFSELEIENAIVAGDKPDGEIAMEQAFLKFNLSPRNYIVAGLFIPRIGILNENHLPVNFNGVERPLVEQMVIPATWRELGVGFYGSLNSAPLTYCVSLMNGLNAAGFEHGTGIREGRAEGGMASANNLALSAAVQYSVANFKVQLSGYMGGTIGLGQRGADSLNLTSGAFGTPVYLGEADVQYALGGFSAKALGCYISYPDANSVNKAYDHNVASNMYGAYAELAYDVLHPMHKKAQLNIFARYEAFDLNSSIPAESALIDETLKQTHLIAGFGYLPIPNVVIKADVRLMHTGDVNPALNINPAPNALPYKNSNTFLNIGIGYSF